MTKMESVHDNLAGAITGSICLVFVAGAAAGIIVMLLFHHPKPLIISPLPSTPEEMQTPPDYYTVPDSDLKG